MSQNTSYGNFALLYDALTDDVEYEKRCDYLEKIFKKHLNTKPELVADLGINSLELADLVYLCEEKFNIVIDDEALHNFTTVGDVVRYIESAQG